MQGLPVQLVSRSPRLDSWEGMEGLNPRTQERGSKGGLDGGWGQETLGARQWEKHRGPCRHSFSYRTVVRPTYKVMYKTVTAREWRCCPGHLGPSCEEGKTAPRFGPHASPRCLGGSGTLLLSRRHCMSGAVPAVAPRTAASEAWLGYSWCPLSLGC